MFNLLEILEAPLPTVTVLDIGAAKTGDREIYSPLLKLDMARVIGIEPDAVQCSSLNNQFGPRDRYLPYVIFDGTRRRMHLTSLGLTSSLYEPDHDLRSKFHQLSELAQVIKTVEVDTRRLDDLEELEGGVDFIKADAQGGEYEIFKSGPNVLESACIVHTEAHLLPVYKEQPLLADQDRVLRQNGYQFHKFAGFLGRPFKPVLMNGDPTRPISQFTQVDAVYVRQFRNIEQMPAVKVLKTALILHEVYRSYDFCHWVLAVYDRCTGGDCAVRYLRRLTGQL
jgi:FkbM family methyltransferase